MASDPRHAGGRPYGGKRGVDLALAALASVPAAVAIALAAVAIKATSPGPVLFRQERIGWHGQPFTVLKLRTMQVGDNPLVPDADRITRVGRWLRRSSLDEAPQLLHVWRGEMSFVGPRPTLGEQVDRYDDRQRQRLAVKPGLTGLAQIRGRNAVAWSVRIEHDLEYVQTQSAWLDLRIVAATFKPLVSGVGVEGHPTDDPFVVGGEHGGVGAPPNSSTGGG